MSEIENYSIRLEKKIDSMQKDIRVLSDHVTRVTVINEAHQNRSVENQKDIDAIAGKVRELEQYVAKTEGAITSTRYLLAIVITIVGWFIAKTF